MRKLIGQFTRFGVVGLVGLVIDLAVFNLLRATVLAPDNLHEGPVLAKIISTSLAIVANWIGNRYWTFREHRGRQLWREFVEFLIVSLGGMLIGLACLWVSHYLLGYTSILADNISTNVIGLALGTLFRFTFYRLWVFAPHRGDRSPAVFPASDGQSDEAASTPSSGAPSGVPAPMLPDARPSAR
jgi:putative flippase GtrA